MKTKKMKQTPTKKVTVRMPEELYLIVRSLALKEKRSTSNQICFLIDLAIECLQQMSAEEEIGEETTDKTRSDAIGFKINNPEED